MTFWDVFSKLCNEIGKKPNPVGKEIGVSSAAIANWKTGSIPNGETLMKIADYFNVSVDYLLGRTDERNNEKNDDDIFISDPDRDKTAEEFMQMFKKLTLIDRIEVMSFTKDKVKQSNIAV